MKRIVAFIPLFSLLVVSAHAYEVKNLIQLTNGPLHEVSPIFNFDGTKIAYRYFNLPYSWSNCDIWTMNVDGSSQTQITDGSDFDPSFSPDGRITFERAFSSNNYDIWIVNPDGSNPHELVGGSLRQTLCCWHPSGNSIVYCSEYTTDASEIWTANANGTNRIKLTDHTIDGHRQFCPVYSRSGDMVAYSNQITQGSPSDIWIMNADGSAKQLVVSGPENSYPVFWWPDDSMLGYIQNYEVWLYNFQTDTNELLLSVSGTLDWADLSPDGSKLVFDFHPTGSNSNHIWIGDVTSGPPEPELLAWWKFDEGSGSTAYDSSGYGKHGTVYGATWATGKIGNALDFDGSNDWVDVPDDISPEHITLEAWIYPTGVYDVGDQGSPIITKETGSGTPPWSGSFAWRLRITPHTHKLQLQCFTPTGAGGGNAVSDTELQMGRWYHVAGTYDGTETRVYINGNLEGSYTAPVAEPLVTSTLPTGIGHLPNWSVQWFEGVIDEVRVYDRALTSQEIAEHAGVGAQLVTLDVDAPNEEWMGSPYRVNIEVSASDSWPGGEVPIDVNETRGPVDVNWNIHDNEYWDFWGGEWRERPDAKWTVYVYDDVLDRWIVEDDDYQFGIEDIPVNLAPGETANFYLEGYHRWYWIEPWNWTRVALIAGGFVPYIGPTVTAFALGKQAGEALSGQHEIEYTYMAAYEGVQDSDATTVKVPVEKYILLGESMVFHVEGCVATLIGTPLLVPPTTPVGLALLVTEAAAIVSGEAAYVVASDPPDFNYTEVVVPQAPNTPELDQVSDLSYRQATDKALELAATEVALRISLERYEGAKIDAMPEYMVLQLEAAKFYAGKKVELAGWLLDFWGPISGNLPIPTPQEIQEIREDLEQNGLPELEVAILLNFGYTPEEMVEIANTLASLPDEYFTSPEKIKDALGIIADGATEYIQYIPENPSEVLSADLRADPNVLILKIKGQWITCYIELPEEYDVADINLSSIRLNGSISPDLLVHEFGDYNGNGVMDLMLTFDRDLLIELLGDVQDGQEILLALTGQLSDGISFVGTDTVKVIDPLEADLWMWPKWIRRSGYSKKKIMAIMKLPKGIEKDDIDEDEMLLLYPGGIEASHQWIIAGRRCRKRVRIMALFDKTALMDAVPDNGRVELQVVGQLKDGRYFYGSDTIRIIGKHKHWWNKYRKCKK